MNTKKIIIHADMDAFFASVEQMDRGLWGLPVIVGSAPDQRGVVSAASYEARKFGVHSAMPSRTAFRLCPHGIFLPVRMKRYGELSAKIMEVFRSFTPLVQPLSVDEAFMDVTGSIRNYGNPVALAKLIKHKVKEETGLTVSVGVAPNKFLAKMASDMNKPDGLTVTPFNEHEIVRFLAPLPIRKVWGVGKKTGERLALLGIKTVEDLQQIDENILVNVLGKISARSLKSLAFGVDNRQIETAVKEKSISNEVTFDQDCYDIQRVKALLADLVEKVSWRLRRNSMKGRTVRLKIRYADFSTFSRQTTLDDCTDITSVFMQKALVLFSEIRISQGVRLIGFGVSGLDDGEAPSQMSFDFDDGAALKQEKELDRTIDFIREKLGGDVLKRGLR